LAFKDGDIAEVNIQDGTIINTTTGEVIKTTPLSDFLLNIIEAGGLIPLLEKNKYVQKK